MFCCDHESVRLLRCEPVKICDIQNNVQLNNGHVNNQVKLITNNHREDNDLVIKKRTNKLSFLNKCLSFALRKGKSY